MSKESPLSRWLNRKKKAEKPASSNYSAPAPAPEKASDSPVGYSLSPGQKRLWLLQELNPSNPFYHYSETYRLKGPLDVKKLNRAFLDTVAHHDILRTTFKVVDSEPRQYVHPDPRFEFFLEDLQSFPPEARKEIYGARCLEKANAPFDLQKGPLSRLVVFQLGQEDFLLLIAMHHIITDKWSMRLLREELAMRYKGIEPTQLKTQYPAYAAGLEGVNIKTEALAYWEKQLSGLPAVLNLPYDQPRPAIPSYKGNFRKTFLPPALTNALKEAARNHNSTLFAYLFSAYGILLCRYSGEEAFAVGTPITNRSKQELEETIGFFNETVALKTDFRGNPTFSELVGQTTETVLTAFSHLDVPFEDIVQRINPERLPGVNPIFQTMFILHVVPEASSFSSGLVMDPIPLDTGVTKFDLTAYVADEGDRLSVTFEYSTDLFKASTIDRMAENFQHLLAEVSHKPGRTIDSISILSPAETTTLLSNWNDTAIALPAGKCIHEIILEVAQTRPNAIAVAFDGQHLTYGELETQAKAVVTQLKETGVKPNQIVGLFTAPSLEMVVGLLAILKAGGAYLPLDPEYPVERIGYLITDAQSKLLITTTDLVAKLPDHYQDQIILLDEAGQVGANAGAEEVIQQVDPDNLAYLIYTSGSTGQPKGVMVSHANLVHSTLARHQYYPTVPTAFLLLSSLSFDSSVAGIFWALTTGAKLVLAPRRIEQDLETLANLISREEVSHTLMLPTLYDTILQFADEERLSGLDTVIVAGEACTSALTQRHRATLPDTRLFNEYGPTEATVWCTAYEITSAMEDQTVPIGRPIPGAEAYVLSPNGHCLNPVGVSGELFIGGKGITKGYWKRPDLTQARFIPNPFKAGERMYRTGDIARWTPDGNLLFLGRADQQIKLRGYRIELGEIQEALMAYPGVTETVVKVDESQRRLAAYFTSPEEIPADALREHLKAQLPRHMVPDFLVCLKEFPRLANGKTDRSRLPAPERISNWPASSLSSRKLAPAEATLRTIWQEALSEENIGIHDNFFEVGGDSILSIQIVARARKAGLHLSPRAIFEHQTIAELVLFLNDARPQEASQVETGNFPLLPIQQWFFSGHLSAPHHWNQAAIFELAPSISEEDVNSIISYLLNIHSGLRQRFHQKKDGSWGVTLPEEPSLHHTVNVSNREVRTDGSIHSIELFLESQQENYPLENVPLLRSYLFPASPGTPARFVLLAHHLIVDVVSWRIIADDLQQLFSQHQRGSSLHLAPASVPYSNWSKTLRQLTLDGRFTNETSFWDAQEHVPLPGSSVPQSPLSETNCPTISVALSVAETAPLLHEIHQAFNTNLQDILLAALLRAVDGNRLHLSLEHNGRNDPDGTTDFSRSVGWFTTSYPITLTDSDDVVRTIISVKETLRKVPNYGLGYGALRYFGNYATNHQPPLLFNYLGRLNSKDDSSDSRWRLLEHGLRAKKSERSHLWEINAGIFDGALTINWRYAEEAFDKGSMNRLVNEYLAAIRNIVSFCAEQQEAIFTPSDFPEANLGQDDLDALLDQIDL